MTKSTKNTALQELLPGGAPKSRRARQTAKAESGKTAKLTVVKDEGEPAPAAQFGVAKHGNGRNWYVTEKGAAVTGGELFKTRLLAQAEADRCNGDVAPAANVEVTVKPEPKANEPEGPAELTGDAIAAMDRLERLAAAKTEMEALREFGGRGPGAPATPVLDWMTDPNSKPATARKAPGATTAFTYTDEQKVRLASLITDGRNLGYSWAKIATAIEAEAIPTSRGGKWYDTTVSDYAKKVNLFAAVPA